MKISEIVKKIKKAKGLMYEYKMLDSMLKTMNKQRKNIQINEEYYENVVKRIEQIKKELEALFK